MGFNGSYPLVNKQFAKWKMVIYSEFIHQKLVIGDWLLDIKFGDKDQEYVFNRHTSRPSRHFPWESPIGGTYHI